MQAWLEATIAEVRLHAEAALLRRLDSGSGFADSRAPAQIFLRDAAASARIAGGTLRPQGTHRNAAAEVQGAIEQASERSAKLLRGDARVVAAWPGLGRPGSEWCCLRRPRRRSTPSSRMRATRSPR